ncbi:PucR family transcriptional regulator [Weissella confusa]|uniref:PucR family transcriptional regulator n=1 Tax=Weissella confusa TaxID=1583 RepID=UPI00223C50AC|nr:helix-turn-helix domain-containing protein [Weissella confusa]MCS9995385.1 PucR family transcriptional regulator [Weissella confusa]
MLQKFMTEWLYISDYDTPVSREFVGEANIHGVDLAKQYVAVVVKGETATMPEYNLAFDLDKYRRCYIMTDECVPSFTSALADSFSIGIGTAHFDISASVKEALYINLLTDDINRVLRYNKFAYLINIAKTQSADKNIVAYFSRLDEEAQLTLWIYANNGAITETAAQLHVHPKTVRYRLNKVMATTGLDPKVGVDLVPLIVSYIQGKTEDYEILVGELQSISDRMLPRDKQAH